MDNCNFMNAFRAPDWRWLRAVGVVNGVQPTTTKHRDGNPGYIWVKRAIQFQQELANCSTNLDRCRLADRHPYLYWAHNLWADDGPLRWSVESYLLARDDDQTLAFRFGLDRRTVEAYEAVFFNVRDRLQHPELIVKSITRRAIEAGMNMREPDQLWKLYGYFYGPDMVAVVSSLFTNPMWVASSDTVGSSVENDTIATLKLKAMISAKTVGVNAQTQLPLLDIFTKFIEVERSSDSANKAESQLLEHVAAMMTAMPFDVGGRDPRRGHIRVQRGLTARYQNTAIELTFDEMLRGGSGHDLPEAEALTDFTFPRICSEAGG